MCGASAASSLSGMLLLVAVVDTTESRGMLELRSSLGGDENV